jgi:hypothetical protein
VTREVVLIAGPPGAGKTTRARTLGLTVYDRDDEQWPTDAEFLAALRHVGADPGSRAVVIRACATRSAWHKMVSLIGATRTELLSPGPDVCRRRIAGDVRAYGLTTWKDPAARLAGVATWYRAHATDPWSPPRTVPAPSRQW